MKDVMDWIASSQNSHVEVLDPTVTVCLELEPFKMQLSLNEVLRMGPEASWTAVLIRRGRDMGKLSHTQKAIWRHRPRREALAHTKPADALTLDFQPQERLSKPPTLWYFVMAAPAD